MMVINKFKNKRYNQRERGDLKTIQMGGLTYAQIVVNPIYLCLH